MHKPIKIKNITLSFPNKNCFENFNTQINYGNRIAIIGRNGSGKTTLLKMLNGEIEPTNGDIQCPDDIIFGFVPQIIEGFDSLSGSQGLNKALTKALSINPNILLLDEPTNHLDNRSRKNLMRMLRAYSGTLIIVSHDTELLRNCIDILWHIDNSKIHIFSGNYNDYLREVHTQRTAIEQQLAQLDRKKKDMHLALMKEQARASRSKAKGEKSIAGRKWPTIVSATKAGRSEETSGRKKSAIDHKKQDLRKQLTKLRLPEIIVPKFSINAASIGDRTIISITDGHIGYTNQKLILQKINLSIYSKNRISIQGDNASGKSTLVKAILNDPAVIKSGNWTLPKSIDIGYLDQHYSTLSPEKTVYETISEWSPTWPPIEIRRHLNNFLFRKNEEVSIKVNQLSGGEKARLSLAQIAALTPNLLILDEITNNLDLETKEHIIEVLKNYPGALIVISHDSDFLKKINIKDSYQIVERILLKLEL